MIINRQKIKENLNELVWKLTSKKPNELEKDRINELRRAVALLEPVFILPTNSRAENAWLANRLELRQNILNRDPRNFLQWPVIHRTMFNEPTKDKLEGLQNSSSWSKWQTLLVENNFGHPPAYKHYKQSSGNLVSHLYSTSCFLEKTEAPVGELKTIFEFGGGYGSIARVFRGLGFSGRYIIFDLPEFSLLQQYFLQTVFPDIKIYTKPTTEASGFIILSDINDLQEQLKLTPPDCFVAMWSLSESPLEIRAQVLPSLNEVRFWFIGYQEKFKSIDNIAYFKQLANERAGIVWVTEQLNPANYYLFGKKN